MTFNNNVPEWKNEGSDPPDTLKEEGFTAGYKPPAAYFNWFFNRIQKSVKEIQDKLSKDLKAMAFKEDIGGEDISETVIETLETIEDKYPVPTAGENVKRFFGKVLTFLRNIRPLTSDITLYVSADTGSDTTGNGTSGNPFKTVQHAVDMLPKDLGGYFATINVVAGTYPEDVKIIGFYGGALFLYSDTKDTIADTCKLQSMDIKYNTAYVMVNGFTLTTTVKDAISVWGCLNVRIWWCQSTVVANYMGIYFGESGGRVLYCKFANKSIVLQAVNSTVYSGNWDPGSTGNTYGLQCLTGAILLLSGAQPIATTLRTQSDGGQYFFANGTQISGIVLSGLSCTWGTLGGGYFRHGNYPSGAAMITLQLYILTTVNLSANTAYYITGLPAADTSNVAITFAPQGAVFNCYLDGTNIYFMPSGNINSGAGFLLNATYKTLS